MPNRKPLRPTHLNLALRAALLSLSLTGPLAMLGATPAHAQHAARGYNIPAGPLDAALSSFAAAADITLPFDAGHARGLHSPGLQGEFTAADGLARLLAGSGLEAVHRGDGNYVLRPAPAEPTSTVLPTVAVSGKAIGSTTEGTGSYTTWSTSSSTRLNLTPQETPQAVTVLTRQRLDDQKLETLVDALNATPGIFVQQHTIGQDSPNIYARGSSLGNFQIDGVPTFSSMSPFLANTAAYDRVEVVRGATGIMNGLGTPAATVNLIRKRPTAKTQRTLTLQGGNWDRYGVGADLSGAANESGTARLRLVGDYNQQGAWVDRFEQKNTALSGIGEFDLSANTMLTVGFNYLRQHTDSAIVSRPLYFGNGERIPLSRSDNTSQEWRYYKHDMDGLFTSLEHRFGSAWIGKVEYSHTRYEYDGLLASFLGTIDPETGAGVTMRPNRWKHRHKQDNLDAYISGVFPLLGRDHELIAGLTLSKLKSQGPGYTLDADYPTATTLQEWANAPAPTFAQTSHSRGEERNYGAFVNARFTLSDATSLLLGGRTTRWTRDYDETSTLWGDYATRERKNTFVPYAGIVHALNNTWSVYASYTKIFRPQDSWISEFVTSSLKPEEGVGYEAGVTGSVVLLSWAPEALAEESSMQTAARSQHYDIPAGPLGAALNRFSEEAGIFLSAPGAMVNGKTSPGLKGRHSIRSGLTALTTGTGLEVFQQQDGSYGVRAAKTAASVSGPTVLPIVTVTGERQERSFLQSTSSVHVAGAEDVDRQSQKGLYGLLQGAVNVTRTAGDSLPSIRGVQVNGKGNSLGELHLTGVPSRLQVVVDDFVRPPQWSNTSQTSLFDVQQVEVMRGPQSTLRGRNAFSGAIVVRTPDPSFSPEFGIASDLFRNDATGTGHNIGIMATGPLIEEQLAARITLEDTRDGDSVEGFAAGGFTAPGDPDRARRITNRKMNAKLSYFPSGAPDLSAEFQFSHADGRTPLYRNYVAGPDFRDRLNPGNDYRVLDTRSSFAGTKLTYVLGASGSLELLVGTAAEDASSNAALNSSGVVFDALRERSTSAELLWRFGDSSGGINGLVGISHVSARSRLGAVAFGFAALENDTRTRATSVFGDLTQRLNDKVDLHYGGRILRSNQRRDFVFMNPLISNETIGKTVFLPKLGISYRLDEHTVLGASARKGFNDGGRTAIVMLAESTRFSPEYVTTYETTFKSMSPDESRWLSVVAFYNDFTDYQAGIQRTANPSDVTIVNQPKARSYGLEVEASSKLSPTITAHGGVGLMRTKITRASAGFNIADGNQFGMAPKVTLNAGVTWQVTPTTSFDMRVQHVGRYFSDITNEPGVVGGRYTTADLGLSHRFGKYAQLRAYVNNASDKLAFITRYHDLSGEVLPGRTIGVKASFAF